MCERRNFHLACCKLSLKNPIDAEYHFIRVRQRLRIYNSLKKLVEINLLVKNSKPGIHFKHN